MAGFDAGGDKSLSDIKKGLRRPQRRVKIRIDMTPMVDIAFLLLIFYMVSTVFAMPQAMEINLPPDKEVPVPKLLTVRVDQDGRHWWNTGPADDNNLPQLLPAAPGSADSTGYRLWTDTLLGLLREQNQAEPNLSTLILIHREAAYQDLVDILDEIDLLERSWNHHTAEQLGTTVDNLPSDRKFSYRYGVGEWEDTDDKIIAYAARQAKERGDLR